MSRRRSHSPKPLVGVEPLAESRKLKARRSQKSEPILGRAAALNYTKVTQWVPISRCRQTIDTYHCPMEATACLVDVAVFKTDEGAKVPWRVRFPSASASRRSAFRFPKR